ncbi:MAG TPA: 2-C-methyl-D-erythritol 4-phosphate cytidylyltransferase [Actinomycetota bacterium]|nr:2-C-methyl-D-erythritol 4-phosphate cytidylyltransferase [Actinomycetota bacterium]
MQRGRGREDARRGAGLTQSGAAAVLAAGGRGRRVASDTPKQFLGLAGRPLFRWSLDALLDAGCAPVVVVVPPGAVADAAALVGGEPDVAVAEGGSSRRRSVARGLAACAERDASPPGRVVVHDAARPFVTAPDVVAVLDALEGAEGAIAAVPVHETLKRVDDGRVVETVARGGLWRAQTPQAFVFAALAQAHSRAAEDGFEATDDAQLLEHYGGSVRVVRGRADNIKITWPEDLALAEAMLRARQ